MSTCLEPGRACTDGTRELGARYTQLYVDHEARKANLNWELDMIMRNTYMQAGKASSVIIHIYAVVFYSDSQIDTAASTGKPCLVVILEIFMYS